MAAAVKAPAASMPDAGSTPDRDGSRSDCACNNGGGGGGATCSSGSTVGVAGRGHGGVSATLKHTSPTAAAGVAGAAAAPPLCSCGAGRGGGSGNCSGSSAPPPPPTAPPQLPPTPTSGGSVSAMLPQRVVRPARLPIRPRVRSGDGPLRRTSMGRGGGGRRPPHVGCCSSGGNGGRSGGGESARRGGGGGPSSVGSQLGDGERVGGEGGDEPSRRHDTAATGAGDRVRGVDDDDGRGHVRAGGRRGAGAPCPPRRDVAASCPFSVLYPRPAARSPPQRSVGVADRVARSARRCAGGGQQRPPGAQA